MVPKTPRRAEKHAVPHVRPSKETQRVESAATETEGRARGACSELDPYAPNPTKSASARCAPRQTTHCLDSLFSSHLMSEAGD